MSHKTAWILIVTLALAVRLLAAVWWQSRIGAEQFYFADSESYWQLGRALAHGEPFAYPTSEFAIFRTPGYPAILAMLFRVWNEPPILAARVIGALLGTAMVALLGWWATQLLDARSGLLAALIAAIYPGAVSMSVFVLAEAPFCPLMVLQLALWGRASQSSKLSEQTTWCIVAGASATLATLMRPSWLLFTPFAWALGLLSSSNRGRRFVTGALMMTSLALFMAPWWMRNYRLTGHFVPTTLQVGASLFDGLNPAADGASHLDQYVPELVAAEHAVPYLNPDVETFEYRLDRRALDESLDWAKTHRSRVVELAWIKFLRIWNVWPNEPGLRNVWMRLAVAGTYVPLLLLSLLGLWKYARGGWPIVLAALPAVYFTLLHIVFVGSLRYREPAMLALIPLAAGVLARAKLGSIAGGNAAAKAVANGALG